MILSSKAKLIGVKSLFEKLIESKNELCFLNVQYRMKPAMGTLISDNFYHSKLLNGVSDSKRVKAAIFRNIFLNPQYPIVFLNTLGDEKKANMSYVNHEQIRVMLDVIEQFNKSRQVNPAEIGIISMYKS